MSVCGKGEVGGGGRRSGKEEREERDVVSLLQSKFLHYPMSVQLHLYAQGEEGKGGETVQLHLYAPGRNLLLRSCTLEGCFNSIF